MGTRNDPIRPNAGDGPSRCAYVDKFDHAPRANAGSFAMLMCPYAGDLLFIPRSGVAHACPELRVEAKQQRAARAAV